MLSGALHGVFLLGVALSLGVLIVAALVPADRTATTADAEQGRQPFKAR
jgi:hypothetical protein